MTAPKQQPLRVTYAAAVHGIEEKAKVISALDEHRTIQGKETEEFERRVAKAFGKKYGILVNSGSSANLLAFELLNLPEGSEVITPLLTFSTTVSPLIKKGLIPVFVDIEQAKFTIDVDLIEKYITKKTKALMIPLLIGNVPNMEKLTKIAKKYNLILIEDSCDTFGASYKGKQTGAYSHISTTSFYGSHIITAGGGGGMIMVNEQESRDRLKVLRGWGRESSIFYDSENIEKRFKAELAGIPYDAKFIFSELGYNFLHPEIGAAFGNAQLDKLAKFKKARDKNFKELWNFFKGYENFFILPIREPTVDTQWLAFPLTIRKDAPFKRLPICVFLEKNNIQTRPVFTGNILKQPGFANIPHKAPQKEYPFTTEVMERSFLVGCHHGMEQKHLDRMKEVFNSFLSKY